MFIVNSNLNIRERLKDITTGPLLKPAVTKKIMLQIQRDNDFKLFIKREIDRMLKEVYKPLNLFGKNPSAKTKSQRGVLDENGNWGYQNYFDTNYSCHEILFNRCNIYVLNLYKKRGIESIEISGETYTHLEPIVIDEEILKNKTETLRRLKRLLILIDNFKTQIFSPGSEILEILIDRCKTSNYYGDRSQSFYVDHIDDFFDDIEEVRAFGGFGNAEDRNTGIDVWTTHIDGTFLSHQIKGTCDITKTDDGYVVNSALSQTSRCNLYVFVCEDRQILILKNIKEEMVWTENGVFFPLKLKYDEKFYNQ